MLDEHYVLYVGAVQIGIRYRFVKEKITFGGFKRNTGVIEDTIKTYFGDIVDRQDIVEISFPAQNKIRYEFKIARSKFRELKTAINKNQYILERHQSTGRLFR